MTQKDNILQELKELNSSLVNLSQLNLYTVPEGYFEGLSEKVMNRIKALEATNANEELSQLSTVLSNISKATPYTVPAGYFDQLAENVMKTIQESNDYQTAKEELESLSPLLSGMKKEMPFSVPDGYFDSVKKVIIPEENKAKIISLGSRKWLRFAAAAVVTSLIVLSGFLFFGKNNSNGEPGSKVMAKITNDIKNMNIEQQNDLIDFIDAGLNGNESVQSKTNNKSNEIQNLLVGVSDEELNNFEEQSEDIQAVLMTN